VGWLVTCEKVRSVGVGRRRRRLINNGFDWKGSDFSGILITTVTVCPDNPDASQRYHAN